MIRDDDRDAKLVRKPLERAHEFGKMVLAGRELPATGEVGSVEGGCGVDDKQREAGFGHHLSGLVEKLKLVVGIVGTGVGDIIENFFAGEAEPFRYCKEPDRSGILLVPCRPSFSRIAQHT